MVILPLIDLLVILGSGTLLVGSVMKAIDVSTYFKPAILGLSSVDFLLMTGVFWILALSLAARTWVKLNEPKLLEVRRKQVAAEARRNTQRVGYRLDEADGEGQATREAAAGER